jgi:hypothetical protein
MGFVLLPGPFGGGRAHDPKYRLLMAVATTMSTRYLRSCPPPIGRLAVGARSGRVHRVGLVEHLPWARRSRPGPPGARRVIRASRVCPPVRLDPSPCEGGWVGCTTVPWGCVGGRPRRGHRPVFDETVLPGATRPAVVPTLHTPASLLDDHGQATPGSGPTRRPMISRTGHPLQGCLPGQNASCRGAGRVLIPLITPQIPAVARGEDGTTARCVAPKPRRSRRERACPRVGDGRPSNHMIR